jgi:hypothetical protein
MKEPPDEQGVRRWSCDGSVYIGPSFVGIGAPMSSKARRWSGVGSVSFSIRSFASGNVFDVKTL